MYDIIWVKCNFVINGMFKSQNMLKSIYKKIGM